MILWFLNLTETLLATTLVNQEEIRQLGEFGGLRIMSNYPKQYQNLLEATNGDILNGDIKEYI